MTAIEAQEGETCSSKDGTFVFPCRRETARMTKHLCLLSAALTVPTVVWCLFAAWPPIEFAVWKTLLAPIAAVCATAFIFWTTHSRSPTRYPNWDSRQAKEVLFHIDQLAHQRINFFLAAEAVFFTAFAAERDFRPALSALGFVSTFCFWYAVARLNFGLSFLERAVKESDPRYRDYGQLGHGSPSSYLFLVWVMPASAFFTWVLLLLWIASPIESFLVLGGTTLFVVGCVKFAKSPLDSKGLAHGAGRTGDTK